MDPSYTLSISSDDEHQEWDKFLKITPGGNLLQSSLWGRIKALRNWRTVRIIARRQEYIVGGSQMLIRSIPFLPFLGNIGYIPRGPVVAHDDPALLKLILTRLQQLIKAERIQYLILQPPRHNNVLVEMLNYGKFRTTPLDLAPTATLTINLEQDLTDIMAKMKHKTRYNIRLSERKGIVVREGGESDLAVFYRLHMATSQRQGFFVPSFEYFAEMWQILSPHENIKIFMADYQGEILSAILIHCFSDTVKLKRIGWANQHGELHPNEALHWGVIKWAKTTGYKTLDFDGLQLDIAGAIINGTVLPDHASQSMSRFKLGFGGQVVMYPPSFDYIYNPILRWIYDTIYPIVNEWQLMRRIRHALT